MNAAGHPSTIESATHYGVIAGANLSRFENSKELINAKDYMTQMH